MTYYTGLARVLRDAGLKVVEVPGWKTRGHGGMGRIKGILAHHTAGPHRSRTSSNYPSLAVVRDGRSGLPGPLAQLGIGYDGTWYVIAAGLAYHSGKVDNPSYGNTHALGIEAENPGDGSAWPKAQYESYVRGVAALIAEWGGKIQVRGHKEAAVPRGRKIDPTFSMDRFRADVGKVNLGENFKPSPAPKPKPGPSGGTTGGASKAPAKARKGPSGQGKAATKSVQRVLKRCGDYRGRIDGDYGPLTIAGVKSYQARQNRSGNAGLLVDGDWGSVTRSWLNWVKKLQRALPKFKGVSRLRVDGDYGTVTHNAVRTLQSRNGLYVDGYAESKTIRFMRNAGATIPNRP